MKELLIEYGYFITLCIGMCTGIAITLLYIMGYTYQLRKENKLMRTLLGRSEEQEL